MQSRRIEYYARYFSMVEVDSTFYRLLPPRTFAAWAERTPAHFVFDVKAYGELTWHQRDDRGVAIAPSAETFARFSDMVQPMRDAGKLGALLFQFPPWFTFGADRFDFFATIRELLPQDTIAVEFRHRSWVEGPHAEETRAALTEHRLAYCVVDEPQVGSGSVPPVVLLTDDAFAMIRFHGRNTHTWYGKNLQSSRDRFDYLYTRDELAPWAERVGRIAEHLSGGQVHVVTNNNGTTKVAPTAGQDTATVSTMRWPSSPQSEAVLNALMLQSLLGQPIGNGEPLPTTLDTGFLRAVLTPGAPGAPGSPAPSAPAGPGA
jgi:uncharacterized protein YecE (DUF72 family)